MKAARCLVGSSPQELKQCADAIIASRKRALFFPDSHSVAEKERINDPVMLPGKDLVFFSRPLPAWHLKGDGCPFVLDTEHTRPWVGGDCNVSRVDDDEVRQLWDFVRETKPANHSLRIRIDIERQRSIASVSTRINEDGTLLLDFNWNGPEDSPSPVGQLGELLQLRPDDVVSDRIIDKPGHEAKMYSGVPIDGYPKRFSDALDAIDFPYENMRIEFFVANYVEPPFESTVYDQQRSILNAISRNWTTEFPAYYRDGIDVFARPAEIPEDVGEVRFPITCIDGKKRIDSPALQIDVVHGPETSFLEFLTKQDVTTLKKYARIAKVPLEFWEGNLADRW